MPANRPTDALRYGPGAGDILCNGIGERRVRNKESHIVFADLAIHKGIETEDNAVAIVKFNNGALGVIEGSTSCFSPTGHPAEVHICGGDGSIFMRDNSFTVWDFKKKKPVDKKIIKKFQAEPGLEKDPTGRKNTLYQL